MSIHLLLGDEAAAQAALDAGIGGAFSYPGTPATEIFEHIARVADPGRVSARWSANEKVAYEEALGMSYAGKRALVSMKHVGLNVAADPFVNSALTGVNGGLVLAVADDPGMHSSQNEQDSRFYAELAQIPAFEPGNQQAAYDLTLRAFSYSEEIGLPVMVRLVTRLAHSRATVAVPDPAPPSPPRDLPDPGDWTLVPAIARRRFGRLLGLQERLRRDAESSGLNALTLAGPRGVVAAGLAGNYLAEVVGADPDLSVLRIGHYPLPVAMLRALVDHCQEILVLEDGYPFIEQRLSGLFGLPGKRVLGKRSGALPPAGELTPDLVAAALGRRPPPAARAGGDLVGRPPQLCQGCPHADTFRALVEALAGEPRPLLFGDIGCYTLGVLPPFRTVQSCVDMGASIAMALGAARAGARPVICSIGDSTFGHSGMAPLLGAARADADMTVLVLDNAAVAMTGGQQSMTSGERLLAVLRGLGVDDAHLRLIEPVPRRHADNVAVLRQEIAHRGLSVIVAARPCIHAVKRSSAEPPSAQPGAPRPEPGP